MRRLRSSGAIAATVGIMLALASGVCCMSAEARTQAQLTATYSERVGMVSMLSAGAATCPVTIAEIVDKRQSPQIVGVIAGRGVLAPTDTGAWLRAVLGGLPIRGVTPLFDGVVPTGTPPRRVRVTFESAWITGSPETYTGSVVLRVTALDEPGAARPPTNSQATDHVYRGRISRTAYWSGGTDTLQRAINGAFADALDGMAMDLRKLCAT